MNKIWEVKDIKELVKDTTVKFLHYRNQELWYEVVGKGFVFKVPIDDIGDAALFPEDKAILFMRYIRKAIEKMKEENKKVEVKNGK